MQIKLVNEEKPHKFRVGDIFRTRFDSVRMFIFTHDKYHALGLDGVSQSHDTSIGLLLQQYGSVEFMGRLEI